MEANILYTKLTSLNMIEVALLYILLYNSAVLPW